MKVLVISRNLPSDFRTKVHGVYQRLRMFLEAIKGIASIDMLVYVSSDLQVSPSVVSQIRQSFLEHWKIDLNLTLFPSQKFPEEKTFSRNVSLHFESCMSLFKQSGYMETSGTQQVQVFEDCLKVQPDAIFVDKLQCMCPLLLTKQPLPPVFFNLDDIEHVSLLRRTSNMAIGRTKLLSYSRVSALMLGERRAIGLAQKTFICSELDRAYLARWGLRKVEVIPNAVSIPQQAPLPDNSTILFIGSYTYQPNIEAAEFLIQKVWPNLYREMPDAKMIIAGAHPERINGYDAGYGGIEFPGFVEDLVNLYHKARIVCTPILTGAGTRVKIVEAAAYGKPIVSTKLGAEGLDMRDGQELLIRDDPESITESCLRLLGDSSLCERLGNAARDRTIQLYDRDNIIRLIQEHVIQETSGEASGSGREQH